MRLFGLGHAVKGMWKRTRTALFPVVEQFASPVAQLILTPFLLHRLSPHDFAIWLLVQSILLGSPALSFGRSIALLSVLPRLDSSERDAAAGYLIRRTALTVAWMSLSVAAVALVAHYLGAGGWSGATFAVASLAISAVLVGVTEVENILTSVLKASGKFAHTAATEVSGRGIQLVATLLMVSPGTSVTVVLGIAVATVVIKIAIKLALTASLLAASRVRQLQSSPTEIDNAIRRIGFWSCVNVASAIAFYSFDRWAILAFSGSTALAAYAVCQQLAQLSHAVPAAASQILIPWTAERVFAGGTSSARNLFVTALWSAVAASILPVLTVLFAPQILAAWISPEFAEQNAPLAQRLGCVFVVLSLNIPFFSMMIGMGRTRQAALLTLLASGCGVIAVLVVAPRDLLVMADLKFIYAVMALLLVPQFVMAVKSLPQHRLNPLTYQGL